jgi:hypothetical protein
MKSPNYIRNKAAAAYLAGALFVGSGAALMMYNCSLPKPRPVEAGECKALLIKSLEIPETEHMVELMEDVYYPGPGQPLAMSAFYEGIAGGKGELGKVVAPAYEEGRYFVFTKPGTTCAGCHREKVKVLDMRPKQRVGDQKGKYT